MDYIVQCHTHVFVYIHNYVHIFRKCYYRINTNIYTNNTKITEYGTHTYIYMCNICINIYTYNMYKDIFDWYYTKF